MKINIVLLDKGSHIYFNVEFLVFEKINIKKCPVPCAQNDPCLNGATCVSNSPSFGSSSCTCVSGYTGANCQYGIFFSNYIFLKKNHFNF